MSRWWWFYCFGLLVVAKRAHADSEQGSSRQNKREADYTLDESFWIEESPAGEVERLLREYTQNQEMVRNIGSHYYQIIYPVQLRQHKKMGISTREVGSSKRGQGDRGGYGNRERQGKTGKHFHRTSLLIKAFNHKFRLDLELNTQLIAPNIMQKHYLANGAEQVSKQDIEHCYYHGKVQDYPGATAAFHTCNGVSGVIHVGNETFVIHPFYGGDLSQKHPHVIFEARTKANKGCATTGMLEWRLNHQGVKVRMKRDIREVTKYIETALVIDKAMFEKRNGSTRIEVVHDSIQVANIADLYFRTLNTRVSVVYIETWQGGDKAQINRHLDIGHALSSFNDYTSRNLFTVDKDTTQLLTGEIFDSGEAGIAVPATVCTTKSVGISVDINTYEPHLLAGTMAHMIGHNIGMGHDDGREECFCKDWHGCIMAKSIVGLDNVQPYKFSQCSMSDYIDRLRTGSGQCLMNKPNELQDRRTCGNYVIDEGEECDCGSIESCPSVDPCCDPLTCKLKSEAKCATGPCCENCKLKEKGVICREATNECDLPEYCTGDTGDCPIDIHKKNGSPCGGEKDKGKCFNGFCPTFTSQCEFVWGYGSIGAAQECFNIFNSKGSIHGHCGRDPHGNYLKCIPENVRCGSLQCQGGGRYPVLERSDQQFYRTITNVKNQEVECKSILREISDENDTIPPYGLVRDGTPCGENLICLNQSCITMFPFVVQDRCPTNDPSLECSGHGHCTNENKCFCEMGYNGTDCSIIEDITPAPPLPDPPVEISTTNLQEHMKKKETPYEDYHGSNTVFLVGTLMSVVGGVFIVFATMALCYRSVVVHNNFSLCLRLVSRNPFSRHDSQRVLFRPSNHVPTVPGPTYPDHKMTHIKRIPVGTEDIEEIGGGFSSGEEERLTTSFIQLSNNHKIPEKKGILKKYDYSMLDDKEGWGDGIQSGEILRAAEHNMMQSFLGKFTGSAEVERTLKTLNGYHDDILEALRKAALQRGNSTPSGSTAALNEELIRRSLKQCQDNYEYQSRSGRGSKENICAEPQIHKVTIEHEDEDDDDGPPAIGTLRIRNLEDLIRQLEHHSRHMSPSGSEDIRMSETEADRHYRQESSSACSESSHQSHRDSRFGYGRYRQSSARLLHPFRKPEEEGIYESADHERNNTGLQDTPDSESDEFIQAQQQLARWASEDTVGGHPGVLGGTGGTTVGPPPREYFPSPTSSTSEEPPSIARAPAPGPPQPPPPHPDHATIHRPKRYPEYKH
ncbi:disintegrin and metalloproteinase domain-containing protein 11 isoform X3 [Anthonomus grandis grandis]|uniref:disintegrin and metalloproteinase domain-containing protein 11 isoform X3 n=1 Tax=Anthonomus grandis grandis TaxID=2921223 RepID=UPI0021657F69|nr:disintegrin and metalloproteinase domain-containing protein 11 isoform X3 [Anthonomus grandis grandis]